VARNDGNAATVYRYEETELEAGLLGTPSQEQISLDDKWKQMESYTWKYTEKEWFDEEYETVNEESERNQKSNENRKQQEVKATQRGGFNRN
jgi:hypothetical protein